MDYLVEALVLGLDSIIFITCMRNYYRNKNAVAMVQGAPYITVDKQLKKFILNHPDQKLPYVSVRGTVKPMGRPIVSSNNPSVEGVVQLLCVKEHVIQRTTTGLWNDSERIIQEVHNVMPFSLEAKGIEIEIVDPLAADILDMDVISDVFHPTVPSLMDHIWGFFAGIRQRGVQSTEKMLRKGTMITGIGELVYSSDGNTLQLQPPSNGAPFYLTNMQVTSLIKKIENSMKNYKWLCIMFGTVGLIVSGLIIRKYLKHRMKLVEEAELKRQVEKARKERRKQIRSHDVGENQLCVVCKENPIEIILLPCGHVCLCEDCSSDILDTCPICRTTIEKKTVAYIA